jgi:hypothetical protein
MFNVNKISSNGILDYVKPYGLRYRVSPGQKVTSNI